METLYTGLIAIAWLFALGQWRAAVFLCVIVDVLRDPVRKLSDSQSVLFTVGAASIWIAVSIGALARDSREVRTLTTRYQDLSRALSLYVIGLGPAFFLSLLLYENGIRIGLVGLASYAAPLIGIGLGYVFAKSTKVVLHLLLTYVVVNCLMLVGTILEYRGMSHRALGGINMDWVRYHGNETIQLISGFYRSPDIMGIHAAHVAVFAMTIGFCVRGARRMLCFAVVPWALVCLILGGRRKSIAIPLVFVASLLAIAYLTRLRGSRRWLAVSFLCAAAAGGVYFFYGQEAASDEQEYVDYASTIVTAAPERVGRALFTSIGTLQQTGILGTGLGTATQGSQNVITSADSIRSWQEDGVSRVFKEFGLPGAMLIFAGVCHVWIAIPQALRLTQGHPRIQLLQACLLAVCLADGMAFVVSHQEFSGDPMTLVLVSLLFGAYLGLPRTTVTERIRQT